MKRILFSISIGLNILLIGGALYAWLSLDGFVQGFVQDNRERLETQFELHGASEAEVVFLGDSITQGGLWTELFPGIGVVNRGIGGDTISNLLARVEQVYALTPKKIFLMIGINDLNRGTPTAEIVTNYRRLFDGFDKHLPDTAIFLQSVLPVNDDWPVTDNSRLPELNRFLREEAIGRGYTYVDLYDAFSDENGMLKKHLSNDGIHLLGAGYALWRAQILGLATR